MKTEQHKILNTVVVFFICAATLLANFLPAAAVAEKYSYWDYKQENTTPDTPSGVEFSIPADGFTLNGAAFAEDGMKLRENTGVTFKVNLIEAGSYFLKFDCYDLTDSMDKLDLSIKINGEVPYDELSRVPVSNYWRNEKENFETDRYGNEVSPVNVKMTGWQTQYALDYRYQSETPLMLPLPVGENEIEITLNLGEMLLKNVTFLSVSEPLKYEDYIKQHSDAKNATKTLTIEAERPAYKNSLSILSVAEQDINASPYDPFKRLINCIDGDSFSGNGQSIFYNITVEESGFYNLAFKYKQSGNQNFSSYRKITIDGEIPFEELAHCRFDYTESYQTVTLGGDTPYKIFLSRGDHLLEIRVQASQYADFSNRMEKMMTELNELYLDLKKLAGNNNDSGRDWKVEEYFPTITDDLRGYVKELEEMDAALRKLNESDESNTVTISIQSAIRTLNNLLKKPDNIPKNMTKLAEGGGSVVQSISDAFALMGWQPMTLDKIYIASPENPQVDDNKSWFDGFKNYWKRFFYSFVDEQYRFKKDDETLTVWINRARNQIDQLQKLTDSTFTKETGIKVDYSQMPEEGKITLSSMGGATPDVAMGISNWMPYDLGVRTIAYDLRRFDDFGEVISNFSPGAMLPLIVNDHAYAIPETQNFNVLFYRKDIFDSLGLKIPQTWDDVMTMMPELQRNGMNFYLPTSGVAASKGLATTAPFVYQYGGKLYSDDGTTSAIDSENAIKGMKMLCSLYTSYGMSQQVGNFFESFRSGTIPVGVASFDTYIMLKIAAPELSGLWDVALSPGVKNADGVIERWQSGSGTTNMIFASSKKTDEAWKLLKWWMSTETQTQYSILLKALYGDEFLWNSANIKAFANNPMEKSHRDVILKQWEWMMEFPRVPGWYMTERELSNTWNAVVFNAKNVRAQIDSSASIATKEIKRKMNELGYLDGDKILKPYRVTEMEDVLAIINK